MSSIHKRRNLFNLYFILQIIVIVVIAAGGAIFIDIRTTASIKRPLQQHAMSIASVFTKQEIESLSGDESDVESSNYQELKARMIRLKKANKDVRFVYLNGTRGGKVFFYGDSENPESDDYSPPGEIYDEASQEFKDIFTKGQPFVEGPLRDRWGNWLSAIAPVKDDEGNVIAAVGMDVAAGNFQKTVLLYASLPGVGMALLLLLVIGSYIFIRRQQQYVDQRDEFISLASHELSTPLSTLKQSMEQVQKSLQYREPPEKLKETVDSMLESVQSLNKTASSLLSLASVDTAKMSDLKIISFDLVESIRTIVTALDLTAQQKNVEVIFAASWPASMVVKGDAEKLHRAFTNVIANAIKYTDPSTTVTISYNREHDQHLISVADHGPGIPEAAGEEIFSGHYRINNDVNTSVPGEGLGLYITRRIIEQHNGSIGYTSHEGEGTIFFVYLPV